MKTDTRLQNFFLPLAVGAILALPAFFLTRTTGDIGTSRPPARPEVQQACGPFVESFTAMRAEAERIAGLATLTLTPSDGESGIRAAAGTWREIAAASRALDAWMWDANDQHAPLTLRETSTVAGLAPLASELRWDAADLANQLASASVESDSAALTRRMQSIARAATGIARALDPLTVCEAPVVTYAPRNTCDTRDPEYQYAMSGTCLY